jgi:hypothetical protein
VLASLDESDVGRIRPGQVVRFRVDAFPTEEFIGSVTQVRLQPTTVQNVVTYQTVIDVPNPELKLKPGMTANVNIEIARRQNVLRVPNTALRFRPTNEIFTALGQTPPPAGGGRGRGAGAGPDTRNALPAQPPAANTQQPTGQQSRATDPQAAAPRNAARFRSSNDGTPPVGRPPADSNASTDASARRSSVGIGDRFDTPAGSDPGSGRGGGDGRNRANLQERMASMSPEERERFTERMRARGFTPPADGQAAAATQSTEAPRRGRGAGPRTAQTTAPAAAQTQAGPTTFDALFGPLTPTESFGVVWLNVDGKLQRVRLRLGITDGQQTELIQALDGKLDEGTELVTSVVTGAVRQTATPQGGAAFPGLGGRGFDRGGGFGGGGGNRGGGSGRGQ